MQYKNDQSLPPHFKKFITRQKNPSYKIWQLESLGLKPIGRFAGNSLIKKKIALLKKRFSHSNQSLVGLLKKQKRLSSFYSQYPKALERISFYFNDPVEVNVRTGKLRHFYLKEKRDKGRDVGDPRLIAFAYSQILANSKGILLHCAGVVKDGLAYLFFAPPEGGKTTVSRLSKAYQILGDDIIAIRKDDKSFFAYPTPWRQKDFIRLRVFPRAKIKAVFYLRKAQEISFKPLKPEEALLRTLSGQIHFFLYTEKQLAKKIFLTAADFFKATPAFEMHFRKDEDFWPLLEKVVNV